MIRSNLSEQWSNQTGQWDFFMNSPGVHTVPANYNILHPASVRLVPDGRVRVSPSQLSMRVVWSESDDVDEFPPSNPDFLKFFEDILLYKCPIRQTIPEPDDWDIPTIDSPFPLLAYTCPHWMSDILPIENILNLRWYLFYGPASALATYQYTTPLPQHLLTTTPYEDTDGTWSHPNAQPFQGNGWLLALLQRELVLDEGDAGSPNIIPITSGFGQNLFITQQIPAIHVVHHLYGAWSLQQDPGPPDRENEEDPPAPLWEQVGPSASMTPIFDPSRQSVWTLVDTSILIPLNRLYLYPN